MSMKLNVLDFDSRVFDIFKSNQFFPFTIIISPFCPLLIKETELVSFLYLIFIVIDVFWSKHFKVATNYIQGFTKRYYSLLSFSVAGQLYWQLTDNTKLDALITVVALAIFFAWSYKFWVAWHQFVDYFNEQNSREVK